MSHVVLLGDSIFDNAAYVPGGPSVLDHLHRLLPSARQVTLLARDGALTADVLPQLDRLPADATHLVVSAGGNDALGHAATILQEPAASYREVLSWLADARDDFRRDCRTMLAQLTSHGKPATVCTVYDSVPGLEPCLSAGLCAFNDAITREAVRAGLSVLDLRLVCREPTDYSSLSPIEPSASGGGKIARAIARLVTDPTGATAASRVFA